MSKCLLSTWELWQLDKSCELITKAFDGTMCGVYLVGSAESGNEHNSRKDLRDVDVRLMLDKETFERHCPTEEVWQLMCVTIGAYLRQQTGLPIDFQVQRTDIANERYRGKPRNPLGHLCRVYAAGGDASPFSLSRRHALSRKELEESKGDGD